MKHFVVAALAFAFVLGPVLAQDEDPKEDQQKDEYSKLIPQAARILEQLPEAQREEVKRRLAELQTVRERVEYLRQVLEQYGKSLAPQDLPKTPEALRDRLIEQAMEQFKNLTPEERREIMEEARKWMEVVPPEQRQEMMKNLMKGLMPGEDEPKADDDEPEREGEKGEKGKKDEISEMLKDVQRYAEEAQQLYDAWQAMPEESRQQMINDLVEGLKIYYEDNVQPEIDRELSRLQREARDAMKDFEEFQRLPREERRKLARERLEKLARRLLGEKEEDEDDEEY